MMKHHLPAAIVLSSILSAMVALIFCELPPSPDNPSRTSVNVILRSPNWKQDSHFLEDSIGNSIKIGAVLHLAENVDSVRLIIATSETTELDTVFSDFGSEVRDTLWHTLVFFTPGTRTVTLTPYSSLDLPEVSASLSIQGVPNRTPSISIDDTIIFQAEPCTLHISISDSDEGQTLTTSMHDNPEEASLLGDTLFTWTPPENFTGDDTIFFIVTDDGINPLSDTDTVIITVLEREVPENHAPRWDDDTIEVELDDTGSYRLQLSDECSDEDNDRTTFLLIPGSPADDMIEDEVYTYGASPAEPGIHFVRIVASDTREATDTLVIRISLSLTQETGASLSRVNISAGTLREQAAPVPDTLRDTVSFYDSLVTVTLTAWNSEASITLGEQTLSSGETSAPLELGEGSNEFQCVVTSGETGRSYVVIFLRKPNSTIPLTDPPGGLTASGISISSIRIEWNDLFGANSYTIQRSDQEQGTFEDAGTSTGNSFVDTGLAEGATYYFRVSGSNANNSTGFSSPVSATTWLRPSIESEPEDRSITEGEKAVFTIKASGIPSPAFQWWKDSVELTGAQRASCTTSVLTLSDNDAHYRCVVSNGAGTVSSRNARVTVDTLISEPAITAQSDDTTVLEGGRSVFKVAASGTNIQYIWRKNGTPLSVQPEAGTLTLTGVTQADAGIYTVKVWNRIDSAVSGPMRLSVTPVFTLAVTCSPATGGTVKKDKSGETFPSGTVVTLTATENTGYGFVAWGGDASGTGKNITIDMTKNMRVTANFIRRLTLTMAITDRGTVSPQGKTTVDEGTEIEISAEPGTGYRFKEWTVTSGSATFTNKNMANTKVRLDSNATVAAVFRGVTFAKQLQIQGYSEIMFRDVVQVEDGGYLLLGSDLLIKIDANGTYTGKYTFPLTNNINSIQPAISGYTVTGTNDFNGYSNITMNGFRQDATPTWNFEYGNAIDDFYRGIIALTTRNLGYILLCMDNQDIVLFKLYESREIDWKLSIPGNASISYLPNDVQETEDGFIIVGATSQGFGSFIIKTDAIGGFQWEASLRKHVSPGDVSAIDLLTNGDCIMCGSGVKDGGQTGYLIKMPPNDTNQISLSYYPGRYFGSMATINDNCFVAGSIENPAVEGDMNILIALIDKNNVLTNQISFGALDKGEHGRALKLTSDGGAIVVGDNNWVIKTNSECKVE